MVRLPKCKICGCTEPQLFKNNNSRCLDCVIENRKKTQKAYLLKKIEKRKRIKTLEVEKDNKNKEDTLFYSLIRAKIFRDGDVKKIRQATIKKILGR